MTFIIACLYYSFIGSCIGFFVHIFNGLIQTRIKFNLTFVKKTTINFTKTLAVMLASTLSMGLVILILPSPQDIEFYHQLVFYLFAFASFDFVFKN
jgi:hypothetical protein